MKKTKNIRRKTSSIYKSIMMIAVAGIFSCTAVAQEQAKHEFSVSLGGGLSTLKYKPEVGSQKNGMGGQVGLGYTYFLNTNWGLSTGAEMSLYNAKTSLDKISAKYLTKDIDETDFEFRSTLSNYKEKQNAMFLNIPLMVQYQTSGKNRFYVAVGGKIGFPITAKYKISSADYRNSGYYILEQYEYTDKEFLGFGNFANRGTKEDLKFDIAYMASVELGMKWTLAGNKSLYTGVYLDYGLNDINKNSGTRNLVDYNTSNPREFVSNSVLTANYTQNEKLTSISKKVNPMAAGIKVRLAFGTGSSKKVEQVEYIAPAPTPQEEKPKVEPKPEPIIDKEDKKLLAEIRKRAQEEEEAKQEAILMADIKQIEVDVTDYSIDQTELSAQAKQDMNGKVALLQKHPNLKVLCIGHTCDLGSTAINHRIGLERAEQAKAYLIEQGIAASRISTISKGATEPISKTNRKANRRVEVVVE